MIRPHSIRTKLTLWYAGILAASLLLFGGLFYASVAINLHQETDRALTLQAEGLAAEIRAFKEADPSATLGNWQPVPAFQAMVQRWADKTGALDSGRRLRVLTTAGAAVVVTKEFEELGLPRDEPELASAAKQWYKASDRFRTLEDPEEPFRLVTHPIFDGGRLIGFAQAGVSLRPMRASLSLLRLWLGSLLPLILLIATIAGFFLASRALGPVDRIIKEVEQISAEALERRVGIPKTGDELERLARTFDHMLERIERAFRRLRQFSAAASHELRTPLTVMKGELELALRRPRDAKEYEKILRIHLSALNDLVHVVEELLMLARSDAAKGAIEWRAIDLNAIAFSMTGLWGKVAKERGVELVVPQGNPVWVTGEQRLLERLVANLVDNALRLTPRGGSVTVRVEPWKEKAQLTVQDTGPGIPAEEVPKIFDRFFQPRSEDNPNGGSAGLGLGLCRWIAEAHQGRIEVSTALGRGTVFSVWFPLRTAAGATSV